MADSPKTERSDLRAGRPVAPDAGAGDQTAGAPDATARVRPKRRRVTTDPPPGSDPTPAPEEPRGSGTENDARLRADKPPHWG